MIPRIGLFKESSHANEENVADGSEKVTHVIQVADSHGESRDLGVICGSDALGGIDVV